jgi:hypothetical protein
VAPSTIIDGAGVGGRVATHRRSYYGFLPSVLGCDERCYKGIP